MDENKKNNYLEERETKLVSVKDLLSNTNKYGQNCYRIPDYQRGYAWSTSTQLNDLWMDIIRIYKNGGNGNHYTGMLSLEKLSDADKKNENLINTNAFYIVDGQQRLTSLIIIIKSLTEYIKEEINENMEDELLSFDNGSIYRFGYSVSRTDNSGQYFNNRIYMGIKNGTYLDAYLNNINCAKEYIDSKLLQYDGNDAKNILKIVLNQIVFNVYFIDKEFDVRVTFETMNTRGKKLSNLELLKNRLMYLTTFFKQDKNQNHEGTLKKEINDAWKTIYENIYYKKDNEYNEIDDDVYLQAHWIVYNSLDKSKGNTYIKDILEKNFSIDEGIFSRFLENNDYEEAYHFIDNYVKSLQFYSYYWKIINNPIENKKSIGNSEEVECLDRLNRITSMKYIKPVVMVIAGEQRLLPNHKTYFYKKLERNLFINRLLNHNKNDYSSLITVAKKIVKAPENDKVKKYNELMTVLENGELCCNDIENIIKNFSHYINEKKDFFYGWDGINYFLYEYNGILSCNDNTKEIDWKQSSIEHILPQTPTRDYWKIILENVKTDEEKNVITNSLGNLLLLSKGENSELQNYSFPTKKDKTVASNKFAYKLGSRSAQEIADNEYWSLNDIYNRQEKLFKFMYNRWIKIKDTDELNNNTTKLTEEVFINLIKNNNLMLSKYNELTDEDKKRLKDLDLSDEENFKNNKKENEDEWYKGLKTVFNTNKCDIRRNSKNIQYIENRFTFTKSGEYLKCGIKIDNKKYRFEYNYNNEIITIWSDRNIQVNDEKLPENAKYFLRTFNRFLKRQEGREKAKIYNNNELN